MEFQRKFSVLRYCEIIFRIKINLYEIIFRSMYLKYEKLFRIIKT